MDYNSVYNCYEELLNLLITKKEILSNDKPFELSKVDDEIRALSEKIQKIDLKNNSKSYTDAQKEELKKLGYEIKRIEEDNEILIKHSLGVINNILSGILNIKEENSYNSKGQKSNIDNGIINSISKEA